jgi:hypothetical protein
MNADMPIFNSILFKMENIFLCNELINLDEFFIYILRYILHKFKSTEPLIFTTSFKIQFFCATWYLTFFSFGVHYCVGLPMIKLVACYITLLPEYSWSLLYEHLTYKHYCRQMAQELIFIRNNYNSSCQNS